MISGLFAGLGWFVLLVFGQIAACRLAKPSIRPKITQILLLAGIACLPLILSISHSSPPSAGRISDSWLISTVWGELTLISLFVLYMPFYYTVVASLSVRTIIILASQPDESLYIADLREHFVSRRLVEQRLETMKKNGFLKQGSEDYALTPKGRFVASIFSKIKRVWKLGPGG